MTKKTNKDLIAQLQASDTPIVLATIKKISESGNSAYLVPLLDLLSKTSSEDVKKRLKLLLAELKHTDAIPVIIDAIQDEKYKKIQKELVSSCWENGLDFSNHISIFVDLVINEEFEVAFEALTVIENLEGKVSPTSKECELAKIKLAIPTADEVNASFLNSLLEIIPQLPQ